jgi:hypothetical protein
MKKENKRVRERVSFEIEAVFTHEGIEHSCICENVSMGGVLLESSEMFPVGAAGTVLIVLTSGSEQLEIKSSCRVARVVSFENDVFHLGLEFEALDSESSIVLYNLLRYQKK